MTKEEDLLKKLKDMIKETKTGKLKWKIDGQSTEYNDPTAKPKVVEDEIEWTVDECYVSYECSWRGEDFLMITYEMIHSAKDKIQTTNMIFLPPLGVRYYDISTLLPYSIEASNILVYEIHELWNMLLDMYKKDNSSVEFDMSPRELTIED